MSKKFKGKPSEFKDAISTLGLRGEWINFEQGLRYKTVDGGTIQWYESTGTILIQGNKVAKDKLENLIENSELDISQSPYTKSSFSDIESELKLQTSNDKIFIVYGHDQTSREQLELVLHKLGLDSFVLSNTAGGGLTIIESLEKEIGKDGSSKFGIVLLTPDDFGYSKIEGVDKAQPRARQNVVLEMGMLISAVGRKNTVILKKGHLEVPSDANGIIYTGFNDHVKETVPRLAERLREAGFEISAANISRAAS